MATTRKKPEEVGLSRYLSPVAVWALSFGCAVGWGSFVMPGTTFLPIAGPMGTLLGLAFGAVVMLVIGMNYHYMMNRYPDAGGTYAYAKRVLGFDHGFLSAWFLMLVYIAIIWANATALPIICRKLLGGVFQFGFHYQIAAFDVYFGEALLSLVSILIFGLVCARGGKFAVGVQTVMAFVLFFGVTIVFGAAFAAKGGEIFTVAPPFASGEFPLKEVVAVAVLAPWAFAGFESISNAAEEFRFPPQKAFAILAASVVPSALMYIFLALLAVSVLPGEYQTWNAYIGNLPNMSGLSGLPTFHAANALMGQTGFYILTAAVIGGVVTGLVGNYIGASRLIYAMARDSVLPDWFGRLNGSHTPSNAVLFVLLLSLPIPFFGRTAISWIIDVATIGATIAYAYTSIIAFMSAREEKNRLVEITGVVGAAVSILFFAYFMVPNFWTISAMSTESYLILIVWSLLGFMFFRFVFHLDTRRRFGKSIVVWIVLLFLIFFTSTMWLRQATHDTTKTVLGNLDSYYAEELREHGVAFGATDIADADYYLQKQMEIVNLSLTNHNLLQMFLITVALFIMFSVYSSMMRREKHLEILKIAAEESNKAKSTFFFNMSHDIRTPMNAILGYTALAQKEKDLPPLIADYLGKIEASGDHLLSLINDILEMSRIESGKMELDIAKGNLEKLMSDVRNLFATQMLEKSLSYTVKTERLTHKTVLCDANRLNRVLLNLISNAYKFTPEGGSITVTLTETGATETEGSYELRVKDTGMGMSQDFADRVFDAYERERTASGIQGTGLGMAITKHIVDLMHGVIEVDTEKGKGTEFIVRASFPLTEDEPEEPAETKVPENAEPSMDFTGVRLLLVDDLDVNREMAKMILGGSGFIVETAENGKIALDMVAASSPGYYRLILMDVQMPVMNGYEATEAIRALPDPALASIPIIAMTANAFAEDVQNAKAAGMDDHIAKPLNIPEMMSTLERILKKS